MNEKSDIQPMMMALGAARAGGGGGAGLCGGGGEGTGAEAAAEAVEARVAEIIAANEKDMAFGREKGLSAAMLDRLMLDEGRIAGIAAGCARWPRRTIRWAQVIAEWDMESGLHIERVRTPLGVIGVIYESRPNVTADAGRAVPEIRQRGDPARRLGKLAFLGRDLVECLKAGCAPPGCPRRRCSWCRRATGRRCARF
jgi:glutamate-5-semialdehyde dehydrogenase